MPSDPVQLEVHIPTNMYERASIDQVESKDPVRYRVIGTLIISKYNCSILQVFEGKSNLVVLDCPIIVKDCTEHITSRVPEMIDHCVHKVVKGILGQQWHSILFIVPFPKEFMDTQHGI